VREGNHLTLVATSYMVIEGLKAADALSAHGVDVEVLDLRCTSDIDQEAIIASVNKTGLLIVADTGHLSLGISAEIIALATQHCFYKLSKAPERVACPSYPASTSAAQLEDYYPTARHVAGAVFKLKSDISEATQREILRCLSPSGPIDVPSVDYAGPF
jgi:pyruvate/2-oxoglutarate/acetoin dehydrogenase E1 component